MDQPLRAGASGTLPPSTASWFRLVHGKTVLAGRTPLLRLRDLEPSTEHSRSLFVHTSHLALESVVASQGHISSPRGRGMRGHSWEGCSVNKGVGMVPCHYLASGSDRSLEYWRPSRMPATGPLQCFRSWQRGKLFFTVHLGPHRGFPGGRVVKNIPAMQEV